LFIRQSLFANIRASLGRMFTNCRETKMHTNLNKILLLLILTIFSATALAGPGRNTVKSDLNTSHNNQLEEIYKTLEKQGFTRVRTWGSSWRVTPTSMRRSTNNYLNTLRVTATAYTSHVGQTDSTPNIAAWGDRLAPGMKVIAVSRDLLNVYGLKHRQKVRIKGLDGEFLVLDKMNKRWRKKIDIYMGKDKRNAFKWGRRKVEIQW